MLLELRGRGYEELRREFRWRIPPTLNIATVCADRHPPHALALVVVPPNGKAPRNYTFGEVTRLSRQLANVLRELTIRPGDRVGIVLPQGIEAAIAHLAVYRLGAVALPLSILFGPDALRFRLLDSGARAVVTDDEGAQKILDLAGELPDLEVILSRGSADRQKPRVVDLWQSIQSASVTFETIITSSEDPALLIYTSGTTGAPKGALHAQRVLLGHLPGFELSHDFFPQPGDLFWTPADWAWIGGLMDALLPSWYHGVPVVAAPRRGFDPEWCFWLLAEYRIRNVFLPPTALKMMRQTDARRRNLSLRTVMSGGEVLGAEVLKWGQEVLGVTINEIYGQTEANYVVGNCAAAWPVRPGSMGRAYPGHDVEILAGDRDPAPPGVVGEIGVRLPDPVAFLGYWRQPEATREKVKDGWLRTGDIAAKDEDGYLWYKARSDDVIISAGYRIGPSEIEECLLRHPAVALAAVIGVPDETRGQAIKAFIVLKEGVVPSSELEQEIRTFVRKRLAAYQYPRYVEFVSNLPLTTTGKVRRAELRQAEEQRRRDTR
ncbi:MAG TPA: acyl-CoA synthetase [Actinomycetota bacterium]|nr:acyl-CoA synthetase [Actinomycetota bacterium]